MAWVSAMEAWVHLLDKLVSGGQIREYWWSVGSVKQGHHLIMLGIGGNNMAARPKAAARAVVQQGNEGRRHQTH